MTRSNFGYVEYLKRNKYRVHWEHGRDENGKRNRFSKTVNGTRDDAEAVLARVLLDRGYADKSMTFDAYWRAVVEPSFENLQLVTVRGYNNVWRAELKPRIGDLPISDLTWRKASNTITSIEAPYTQRHAYRLLKKICNMAIRDEIIDSNPVQAIKMKRIVKREKHMIEAADMTAYLDSIAGTRYEPLVMLEALCGLRHEEACAMVGEKIVRDGEYAVVTVDLALTSVDGKKILKETKNEFSEREVLLAEPFATRLLGAVGDKAGPIAPSHIGGDGVYAYANPERISANWKRYCKRNGIEYVRFGDMRSIYATLQAEAGSLDSLVSLSMGHSDGTTRGKNYQKQTRKGLEIIAENLAEHVENAGHLGAS